MTRPVVSGFSCTALLLSLLASVPALAGEPPKPNEGLRPEAGTVSRQSMAAYYGTKSSGYTEHPAAFGHRDIKVEATVSFQSEYVFRGEQRAKHNAQGGLEISSGGFYAGGWAILPTEDRYNAFQDEVDIYGGYGYDLTSTVYVDAGVTGYIYNSPQLLFNNRDSVEVYGGISLNLPLKPSLYGFYDFTNNAVTVEGSLENTLPFGRVDLVTGATGGYTDGDGFKYSYFQADGELVYNFTRQFSLGAGGHWAVASDNNFINGLSFTQDNSAWYGITLKARN